MRIRFAFNALLALLVLQLASALVDPAECPDSCRWIVVPALGPAGPVGQIGDRGERGLQGLPGVAGTNGIDGIDGIDGRNGTQGEKGDVGPRGESGEKGETGPAGPTGPIGPIGPQGLKGDTGLNGTNGVDGIDGKDGINGTNGVDGIDGKDGINGTNGVDGKDGKDGINGANGGWNASATYTGGTLMSPAIVTPTISDAVLTLKNPGGTTSLSLDHYEYLKTRSLSAIGYGGLSLGNFPITLVRVGRMVTMYIGVLDSPNPGAHGTHIYVTVSAAQFPHRFRPAGNPIYSVPVISNGIHILGSVRVESSGTMTFWGGAPNTPFQQDPWPITAGWPDTAISWIVGFDN